MKACPTSSLKACFTSRSLRLVVVTVFLSVTLRAQSPAQPRSVFRSGTELVTVNVVVRDKNNAVVRGLTQDDFIVTEDDKSQQITSFDFEELDKVETPVTTPEQPIILPQQAPARADVVAAAPAAPKVDMHGRRLIVLFFDLSSMQPEELTRAVKAAHDYVNDKLSPADLIAIASFSSDLNVDQDFTSDRETLNDAIDAYGGANAGGFDDGTTGRLRRHTPDNGTAFAADDTEFNIFNTDRRLDALQERWLDQLAGHRAEEIGHLLQQRHESIRHRQSSAAAADDRSRQPRERVALRRRHARFAGACRAGGDATTGSIGAAQSAFSSAVHLRNAGSTECSRSAGDADDDGRRTPAAKCVLRSEHVRQVFDKAQVNDTSAYSRARLLELRTRRATSRFRRIKGRS